MICQDILEKGRAAWPALGLADGVFFDFLRSKDIPDLTVASLHAADLYLVCACVQGNEAAIVAFERAYFGELAAQARNTSFSLDDLRQRLRARLFVGQAPKIASYSGRSSLRTWLRVVIGRFIIDVSRERQPDPLATDSVLSSVPASIDDPSRRMLKQTCQDALEAAFHGAAERLSTRDKNLLRYSLAEGMNIDEIGLLYGVHRVTAARWLQQARASLIEQVRAFMMSRLQVTESELKSVLRSVMSQLELTVSEFLRAEQVRT